MNWPAIRAFNRAYGISIQELRTETLEQMPTKMNSTYNELLWRVASRFKLTAEELEDMVSHAGLAEWEHIKR